MTEPTPERVPEYTVPYQFIATEDTYRMAVDLYLEDVLRRRSQGHKLPHIIAEDAIRSMQWRTEIRKDKQS